MSTTHPETFNALASRWASAGSAFPPIDVTRDADFQRQRLLASDVDPAIYNGTCEAGLFGLDCFRAMNEADLDIDGYVFVSQTLRQLRPIALNETLTMSGHVRERRPVRGGLSIVDCFLITDSASRVVLESELTGFLIDAVARQAASGSVAGLVRRSELAHPAFEKIAEKRLTPDKVRAFSEDVGNIIHFDLAYAQQHGFRAPLAQGVMSAVWLLSSLSSAGQVPSAFDVDIRFLRPVFWDEEAHLFATFDAASRHVTSAQSRNVDGKATADMIVHWVQYDSAERRG